MRCVRIQKQGSGAGAAGPQCRCALDEEPRDGAGPEMVFRDFFYIQAENSAQRVLCTYTYVLRVCKYYLAAKATAPAPAHTPALTRAHTHASGATPELRGVGQTPQHSPRS